MTNDETASSKSDNCIKNTRSYFCEYCKSTSIHGVKYVGEQQRSLIERILWSLIFATSLYFCIQLIVDTYNKWDRTPVLVTFATTQTPVWKIPFPAVTICPEIKSKPRIYNFSKNFERIRDMENLTQEEYEDFEMAFVLCGDLDYGLQFPDNDFLPGEKLLNFLTNVAPILHEVVVSCTWMGVQRPCEDLFTPVMTDEGICFTFNSLDREELYSDKVVHFRDFHKSNLSEWSLENGYNSNSLTDAYPKRTSTAGTLAGLKLFLIAPEIDLDFICRGTIVGYKVLLHSPADVPRVSRRYFQIPLDNLFVASVKADFMGTSEELRGYSFEKRQCYFPNEKKLRYFKIYSQENCDLECLTNLTFYVCGCVSFYMPRDNSTMICGRKKMTCANSIEEIYLSNDLRIEKKKITTEYEREENCNCLPACTTLSYDMEGSQSHLDWPKFFQVMRQEIGPIEDFDEKIDHFSELKLFFKEMQFITKKRHELYGYTDFFANCGGLLGLFIGFSVISVVEIFYFLTLRLGCNIKYRGCDRWSNGTNHVYKIEQ